MSEAMKKVINNTTNFTHNFADCRTEPGQGICIDTYPEAAEDLVRHNLKHIIAEDKIKKLEGELFFAKNNEEERKCLELVKKESVKKELIFRLGVLQGFIEAQDADIWEAFDESVCDLQNNIEDITKVYYPEKVDF